MPASPDSLDPGLLHKLVTVEMPFGKYQGHVLADLPGNYLAWFAREGFPKGELGRLLSLMLEIDHNGLKPLLSPLRDGGARRSNPHLSIADPRMPTLSTPSLTIDCIDEGAGLAVVLVHSSVSGNRQWKRLVDRLRPRYRVLAPNLYGYGATTAWDASRKLTREAATEVVLRVCETVDGPLRLVGHSWGGALALTAAAQLGDRVSHVVAYEPMLTGLLVARGTDAAKAEAARMYASVRELGDAGEWQSLGQVFADYFNGDGAWSAMPPERRQALVGQLPPNRFEWDATSVALSPAAFDAISARTLLMRGAQSRPMLREMCDILLEAHPRWEAQEFASAAHMGPLTHADAVNAAIEEFIGRPG